MLSSIQSSSTPASMLSSQRFSRETTTDVTHQQNPEIQQAFDQFVGESLFGMMLKSMRKTQQKSEYFNGGRAEEVFQQQLDQVLAQKLSHASASKLSTPMYEVAGLGRR